MITFNQFASFLKEEGVYGEFFNYMRTLGDRHNKYLNNERIFEGAPDKYLIISGGFIWQSTQEGWAFWESVNKKYKEYYDTLEKVGKTDSYEFVFVDKVVAKVKLPKNPTIAQLGFINSWLLEHYKDATETKNDGDFIYAIQKIWDLKKI